MDFTTAFVILVILFLALACAIVWMTTPNHYRPFELPLVWAHRGLHDAAKPENSLGAFRAAAERGLGSELDVRLTKDGVPVVFHDANTARMCGIDRTVAEIRHIFSKNGGNMGEAGSVAWMFDKKGYFVVDKAAKSEDELFDIVIEAGADDMQGEGDVFEIFTSPDAFEAVSDALKAAGVETQAAEISMIPQNYIALTGDDARKMMKLYDALDDNDDVQKVYANFDIDESEME